MSAERKFIKDNLERVLLREYLMKEAEKAGFGGLEVQRTPVGTRVVLITERPGMVIGRRGKEISRLTSEIQEKFNFDNPQIEVKDAENPRVNAQIMASKLASALERGFNFRRAGQNTLKRIMQAGARGVHIVLAGKITGARHRVEKFKDGHIKFCGEPRQMFVEVGFSVAKKKLGIIGVKVEVLKSTAKFPDEVSVTGKIDPMVLSQINAVRSELNLDELDVADYIEEEPEPEPQPPAEGDEAETTTEGEGQVSVEAKDESKDEVGEKKEDTTEATEAKEQPAGENPVKEVKTEEKTNEEQ